MSTWLCLLGSGAIGSPPSAEGDGKRPDGGPIWAHWSGAKVSVWRSKSGSCHPEIIQEFAGFRAQKSIYLYQLQQWFFAADCDHYKQQLKRHRTPNLGPGFSSGFFGICPGVLRVGVFCLVVHRLSPGSSWSRLRADTGGSIPPEEQGNVEGEEAQNVIRGVGGVQVGLRGGGNTLGAGGSSSVSARGIYYALYEPYRRIVQEFADQGGLPAEVTKAPV